VADDGQPLSLKSIDKIFVQIRESYPGLAVTLTRHVMRHTWNDRFSEQGVRARCRDLGRSYSDTFGFKLAT
jgi:hypothetical protein